MSLRASRKRLRSARLAGLAAVVGVLLAGGVVTPSTLTASAVPGTPGAPQSPTLVWSEGFENGTTNTPSTLTAYSGAAGQTYTADAFWRNYQNCNGVITNYNANLPIVDLVPNFPAGLCSNSDAPQSQVNVRRMADVLGQVNAGVAGGTTASPANGSTAATRSNHAMTAWTTSVDGVANEVVFRTVNPLALAPATSRYYTTSVDVVEASCAFLGGINNSKLSFYLVIGGVETRVNQADIRACTSPLARAFTSPVVPNSLRTNATAWGSGGPSVQAGRFFSDNALLLTPAQVSNLGVVMRNATGVARGNDFSFDNIRLYDATPQVDKAFSPTLIRNGGTSTMTLTVTNTSDLAAKSDWFITDALPTNLKIAAVPNVGGTCVQRAGAPYAVVAPAGGTTVSVTGGDLAVNEASCTITVDVTSTVNGTYVNGPANVTTNLNPPANASLEVIQPSIDIVKSITAVNGVAVTSDTDPDKAYSKVGDVITYSFVATNTTPKAATNTTLNTNLTNVRITEDSFSGAGDMTTLSCIPPQGSTLASGAKMTCSATYVVQQADLDNAPLTNVARASGTPAAGPNVTDTDDEVIPATWKPALVIDKTASVVDVDQDGVTGLGDHLLYAFDVTNTGNVTAANIAVVDDRLTQRSITVTCTPTTIAPTQVAHCVANAPYVIGQADVDAKEVINTAYSTGTDPKGGPVRSNDDSIETPIEPFRISLKIEKVGESGANTWVRMDGSSFAVLADVNGEPGAALPFTINGIETGLFEIGSIAAGTYWLSELEAPDGFSLLAAPVKFIINPDRTVSVTAGGDEAVTATGQIITVRDEPALTLPITGGTGAMPYILAGSLTVLGAGGLALWVRRRNARADTHDSQI